jgi:hypothetical protein
VAPADETRRFQTRTPARERSTTTEEDKTLSRSIKTGLAERISPGPSF